MLRNFISILCIFFFFLVFFISNVNAQTHPCTSATSNETLITCYEGFHFSNPVWSCVGTDEVQCRINFGKQVDVKLDEWAPCWFGVCNPWSPRTTTWNTIMGIFDIKRIEIKDPANEEVLINTPTPTVTLQPTATPTITPTPVQNSITRYHEACLSRIIQNNSCNQNLKALYDCYDDDNLMGPENGVWSCTDEAGQSIDRNVCKEAHINLIKRRVASVTSYDCGENEYNVAGTSQVVSYNLLRTQFDRRVTQREDRLQITPGTGILQPTIVITQAVVEEALTVDIVDDDATTDEDLIEEAWNVLTCGFANGDVEGKNACCLNTIDQINPNFSSMDNIVDPNCNWFAEAVGLCPVPDLTQFAKDRLMNYLNDNEVVPKLNVYTQKEGNLPKCFVGVPDGSGKSCKCIYEASTAICDRYIDDPIVSARCVSCMQDNDEDTKRFFTAFGCIDSTMDGIINMVFTFGLGIAGTIALFCIIYSAFMMQTSQNNPEKIQGAQERITACITGLILIIFSVFILRVIGVDILRIPGFSNSNTNQSVTDSSTIKE